MVVEKHAGTRREDDACDAEIGIEVEAVDLRIEVAQIEAIISKIKQIGESQNILVAVEVVDVRRIVQEGAVAEIDRVIEHGLLEGVHAAAANQETATRIGGKQVVAFATIDKVVAIPAEQLVIAESAGQLIEPATAVDDVVATVTVEGVDIRIVAQDQVVEVGAAYALDIGDRVGAGVPAGVAVLGVTGQQIDLHAPATRL